VDRKVRALFVLEPLRRLHRLSVAPQVPTRLTPLSNPIWSRLYGPFGVEEVVVRLGRPSQQWAKDMANGLS
jgi:hypothetical protein